MGFLFKKILFDVAVTISFRLQYDASLLHPI